MSDQKTDQKTLRDEFAMAALSGYMASGDAFVRGQHSIAENDRLVAAHCWALADAMLAARTKEAK